MATKTKWKKPEAKRQTRLDQRSKQLMFAVLLRNESVFKQVQELLTDQFESHDVVYRVVWETVVEYFNKLEHLPQYELLAAEIEERLKSDPALLSGVEIEQMNEFLTFAYDPSTFSLPVETDETIAKWTLSKVRQFIVEHALVEMHQNLITEDSIPLHVPDVLSKLITRVQNVDSIGSTHNSTAFPDDWETDIALDIRPTNLTFLDHYINGGHVPGELYGVLGPFGSCKSTIAYALSVEQATAAYNRFTNTHPGSKRRVAFIVSYEDRIKMMRQRSMGYAARISRQVMEGMKSYADLSTTGSLRDYELREYRDAIRTAGLENTPGERERVQQQKEILNNHLCLLDLTGFDRKGVGGGSIREIAGLINSELRRRDAECACVVIDYMGAMVRRFIAMNDGEVDNIRHYMAASIIDAKSLLADEFNTPVWLLHQLNGDANSWLGAKIADHTSASEIKSYAENLDFCFSISRIQANNLAVIGCTKHRRAGGQEKKVIHVKGELYRVDDASATYRVNPDTNTIENPHDRARITDTDELRVNPDAVTQAPQADDASGIDDGF